MDTKKILAAIETLKKLIPEINDYMDLHAYEKADLETLLLTADHIAQLRSRLKAYEDAEKQGLLVRLPCKVGDTVYLVRKYEERNIIKTRVQGISISASSTDTILHFGNFCNEWGSSLGKSWTLSYKTAEQALWERGKT